MSEITQIHPIVSNYTSFIRSHERLLAIVLGAFLIYHCYGAYLTNSIEKAKALASSTSQTLAVQQQANADQTTKLNTQLSDLKIQMEQVQANNAALSQAIASRNQALAQTQANVATATLPQVVVQWQSLVPGLTTGDFTADAKGTIVSDAAARATVSSLAELPIDRANIKDLETEITGKDAVITSQGNAITSSNTLITGLNTQIQDQTKACNAQIVLIKAEAKKGKRSWFLRGLGIGGGIIAFVLR